MFNKYMTAKELNVKVGDRVNVMGYKGTVIDVYRGVKTEWNGTEYAPVADSDFTQVQVHFDDPTSIGYQYQDGWYGGYSVISH